MEFIKNIKLLMLAGLLLQVGIGFATDWEPTGPTLEDIQASTKVENLAVKGSPEDTLLSALKNGDLKNVETLVAACTGLEARDNENMTALMLAARKGYTDIVSKLIMAGANMSAKDRYGCKTSLFYAFDNGYTEIVKLLIANGAAKTQKNLGELLVSAVYKGNNEMAKALLSADVNMDSNTLETAYEFARNADMKKAIKDYRNKCKIVLK